MCTRKFLHFMRLQVSVVVFKQHTPIAIWTSFEPLEPRVRIQREVRQANTRVLFLLFNPTLQAVSVDILELRLSLNNSAQERKILCF